MGMIQASKIYTRTTIRKGSIPLSSHKAFVLLLALGFGAVTLSGCASIADGGKYKPVYVASQPNGATILLDGTSQGKTPKTIQVNRKKAHSLVLNLAGYPTKEIKIKKGLNGWVFGNILFGYAGIPAVVIDIVTGAIVTPKPSEINHNFDVSSNVSTSP